MKLRKVWLRIGLGLGVLLFVCTTNNTQAQSLEDRVQRLEAELDDKIAKLQLPGWLKILQFSGDLRLRYQYEKEDLDDEEDEPDRHRGRFRYRLGIDANVLPNL